MIPEYPGNSRRPVQPSGPEKPAVEEVKLEPVVTGKVIRRKKSFGRRMRETFFNGDSGNVFSYLLKEVLVPALQDTATKMVTQGIERAVYGEVQSPNRSYRSPVRGAPVPYDRYTTSRTTVSAGVTPRRPITQPSSVELGDIVLDSKAEVEDVVDKMYWALEQYDVVTVANLNELLKQTSHLTDHKYGWTDLNGVKTQRVRDGYLLILPDPEDLR